MRNVQASLEQAGLGFSHVVLSHLFVDDAKNLQQAAAVYNEFFQEGSEPACATVLVDWIPGGSHVEVTCLATTDLSSRRVVRPANVSVSGGVKASPGVWAGNTLYLSGFGGLQRAEGKEKPAGALDAQVHHMASHHVSVLEAAGLKLDDIVSGCVYLANMDDYDGMNAVYRQYFSRGPGVRTCLMPTKALVQGDDRVLASFIAARTQPFEPAGK
jgi:enamine deaminase RidA (YjgF/YER057c/UK114 family)